MGNPQLRLVTPATVNRTVTPRRAKNSELRSREYLTAQEIEALMDAARKNRHGHRDSTMILIAFRHGLRASELIACVGSRSITVAPPLASSISWAQQYPAHGSLYGVSARPVQELLARIGVTS
jgi:hypothetical protein